MNEVVTRGLYRHFKGLVCYVTEIVKDTTGCGSQRVIFQYVDRPNMGSYSRDMNEWSSRTDFNGNEIKDRPDNITGQVCRFEKIKSFDNPVGSISTEQLLKELITRTDSPLYGLDVKGAESEVLCKDYVCGYPMYSYEKNTYYLPQVIPFFTLEEAEKYCASHCNSSNNRPQIYKRVLIEV